MPIGSLSTLESSSFYSSFAATPLSLFLRLPNNLFFSFFQSLFTFKKPLSKFLTDLSKKVLKSFSLIQVLLRVIQRRFSLSCVTRWVDLFWSRVFSRTNWVFFQLWITYLIWGKILLDFDFEVGLLSNYNFFFGNLDLKIVIYVSSCVFFQSGPCSLLNSSKSISILLDLVFILLMTQIVKQRCCLSNSQSIYWWSSFSGIGFGILVEGSRGIRIWRLEVWKSASSPKKPPPLQK